MIECPIVTYAENYESRVTPLIDALGVMESQIRDTKDLHPDTVEDMLANLPRSTSLAIVRHVRYDALRRLVLGIDQDKPLTIGEVFLNTNSGTERLVVFGVGWLRYQTDPLPTSMLNNGLVRYGIDHEHVWFIPEETTWRDPPKHRPDMENTTVLTKAINESTQGGSTSPFLDFLNEPALPALAGLKQFCCLSQVTASYVWRSFTQRMPYTAVWWEWLMRCYLSELKPADVARQSDPDWFANYFNRAEYPVALETRDPDFLPRQSMLFAHALFGSEYFNLIMMFVGELPEPDIPPWSKPTAGGNPVAGVFHAYAALCQGHVLLKLGEVNDENALWGILTFYKMMWERLNLEFPEGLIPNDVKLDPELVSRLSSFVEYYATEFVD